MPAFQKLVENLINIHRFSGLHDTYEELRNDCVAFLFETIRKFDGTRGTNAFSYFNVVAKNWLIIRTKQRVQRMRRSVSLDDPTALSTAEQKHIDDVTMASPQPKVMSGDVGALVELLREIKTRAKNENELSCINSIITVFDQVDEIDLLSKGAVLMYIRELSGLTPKQLTTTMQAVKRHYRKLRTDPRFDGALG